MLRLISFFLLLCVSTLHAQPAPETIRAPLQEPITPATINAYIAANIPTDLLDGAPVGLALKHPAVAALLTTQTRRTLIDYILANKFKSYTHKGKNLAFSHETGYVHWPAPKPAQRYYTITTTNIEQTIKNLRPYEKLLGFAPKTSVLTHTELRSPGADEVNMNVEVTSYILIIENVLEVQATLESLNRLQSEAILEK